MSEKEDYFDLKMLSGTKGYQKLMALWAHEYAAVMKSLQFTASKNNESNWRFQAGILKGFDLAVGQLERALADLEKVGATATDNEATKTVEELLKEVRGEKQ